VFAKEVKALQRRFYEECNKGKANALAVLDSVCSDEIVWHSAGGREIRGFKDLKLSFGLAYSTFPDSHFIIDDVIVEGDKAVNRFTFTGTHKGEFNGVLPTNKRVKVWGIALVRLANGKFSEVWERYDTLGWMQELGLVTRLGKNNK
jgi:predicted ester cyclase